MILKGKQTSIKGTARQIIKIIMERKILNKTGMSQSACEDRKVLCTIIWLIRVHNLIYF